MNTEQIKKDIREIELFRESLSRQQLSFPLDLLSRNEVERDALVPTGAATFPAGIIPFDDFIEVFVNNEKYLLQSTLPY